MSLRHAASPVENVGSCRGYRVLEITLDPAPAPLVDLELREVMEILAEGPAFTLGLLRDVAGVPRE